MAKHILTSALGTAALLISLTGCGAGDKNITASSSGQEVYDQTCAGCHSGGLKGWLTGAPTTGDKEVWQPLMAKGTEAMTAITIKGVEKMPAKGGCSKCSDEQIQAAVEVMVKQSS